MHALAMRAGVDSNAAPGAVPQQTNHRELSQNFKKTFLAFAGSILEKLELRRSLRNRACRRVRVTRR